MNKNSLTIWITWWPPSKSGLPLKTATSMPVESTGCQIRNYVFFFYQEDKIFQNGQNHVHITQSSYFYVILKSIVNTGMIT
ncbi:unnamed protein product, partial [Heterotrigona itama]